VNTGIENEVVLNKMDREEKVDNFATSSWTKKESKQIIIYFIVAFVVLFMLGFLVNQFLL